MMESITFTAYDLHQMLQKAAYDGARYFAQEYDLIKTTITRQEVIKLYGKMVFKHSQTFVKWQKKGGANSQVFAQRDEFINYIKQFDVELITKKTRKNNLKASRYDNRATSI